MNRLLFAIGLIFTLVHPDVFAAQLNCKNTTDNPCTASEKDCTSHCTQYGVSMWVQLTSSCYCATEEKVTPKNKKLKKDDKNIK